jgi:hypothetical protein
VVMKDPCFRRNGVICECTTNGYSTRRCWKQAMSKHKEPLPVIKTSRRIPADVVLRMLMDCTCSHVDSCSLNWPFAATSQSGEHRPQQSLTTSSLTELQSLFSQSTTTAPACSTATLHATASGHVCLQTAVALPCQHEDSTMLLLPCLQH